MNYLIVMLYVMEICIIEQLNISKYYIIIAGAQSLSNIMNREFKAVYTYKLETALGLSTKKLQKIKDKANICT